VQVYKPEVTNGCPGGAMNRDKTADLAVTVEGHGYAISMPADQVYQIQTCDEVSAVAPRIEPASATPSSP
jgi:hypothetical protein